jgi:hypothetical protein
MYARLFHYYKIGLPFAVTISTSLSGMIGIVEHKHDDVLYTHHRIMNVLGLISMGALFGFTYPVSVPLLAARQFIKN